MSKAIVERVGGKAGEQYQVVEADSASYHSKQLKGRNAITIIQGDDEKKNYMEGP